MPLQGYETLWNKELENCFGSYSLNWQVCCAARLHLDMSNVCAFLLCLLSCSTCLGLRVLVPFWSGMDVVCLWVRAS